MKRSVHFAEGTAEGSNVNEDSAEETLAAKRRASAKHGRFKEKHSLDSDEEDDDEDKKFGKMHNDDVEAEGCEDATIEFDDNIKITPFNMREEMEEGHFDSQGNYVWKKDAEIRDEWMDNIDWVSVKRDKAKEKSYKVKVGDGGILDDDSDSSSEEGDEGAPKRRSKAELYTEALKWVKPGETVIKAIRRLGGSSGGTKGRGGTKGSASERWSKKKKAASDQSTSSEADKEGMLSLTGVADELLGHGEVDIYQTSHERLKVISQPTSREDTAADMFGDDFDDEKTAPSGQGKTAETGKGASSDDEVRWEYRLKNENSSEILGPVSSQQMLDWMESNHFEQDIYVRKFGTSSDFYSTRRIDFDLYV